MNKPNIQDKSGSHVQTGASGSSALRQAQEALKNLKNRLNLSDEAMANALGVPLTRMVVILYGEPAKIPAKITGKIRVMEALATRDQDPAVAAKAASDRKRASPVVLRADQKELLELQKSLGLTHDDLARIAGIPRSRMMTYVYGRTRAIPQAVLEAIRQVRDGKKPEETPFLFDAVKELECPLPEFIARWQKRLGLNMDDHVEIAKALGVSKSTLLRWLDGHSSTRPSFLRKCLASLHDYERTRRAVKSPSAPL